jgi:hypothetical protein
MAKRQCDHRLRLNVRMITDSQIEVTVSDDGAGFKKPGNIFLETARVQSTAAMAWLAIRKLIPCARGANHRLQ